MVAHVTRSTYFIMSACDNKSVHGRKCPQRSRKFENVVESSTGKTTVGCVDIYAHVAKLLGRGCVRMFLLERPEQHIMRWSPIFDTALACGQQRLQT